MASDNFLGMFGSGRRDREEDQKAFYAYFDGNHHKLVENQVKLMNAIKKLADKLDALQEKLDAIEQKLDDAPAGQARPSGNAVFGTSGYVEAYVDDVPAYADPYVSAPQTAAAPAAAAAPAPFYANLEGDVFIPISEDMKENALFRIEPISANEAMVEFNTLSVPTYISWGPATFENSFECIVDNKDPNGIRAENTTTAHYADGVWMIDGRIRLRFI